MLLPCRLRSRCTTFLLLLLLRITLVVSLLPIMHHWMHWTTTKQIALSFTFPMAYCCYSCYFSVTAIFTVTCSPAPPSPLQSALISFFIITIIILHIIILIHGPPPYHILRTTIRLHVCLLLLLLLGMMNWWSCPPPPMLRSAAALCRYNRPSASPRTVHSPFGRPSWSCAAAVNAAAAA